MRLSKVMGQLERFGTAQNRKIYKRHGAGEKMYGVSFANLGTLKKQIKVDHQLAKQLWATGNVDARTLATMIVEPQSATSAALEAWPRDLDYYPLTDCFVSGYAAKTRFARAKADKWSRSRSEWMGRAGWQLVAQLALHDEGLSDEYFEARLAEAESRLHDSKNRIRDAMNNAVIAIGLRNPRLGRKAVQTARRIGAVVVDHGDTSCKTPDAVAYIARVRDRRRASGGTQRRNTLASRKKK